jgi:anti-sigma factor RsiW
VLTCYFYRRRIDAWLDGALDQQGARRIEAHVAHCRRCAAEAEAIRVLTGELRSVPAAREPDWSGFWPGVVRGIQDAQQPERRRPHSWTWLRPRWAYGGGALAAALLITLGVWEFMPGAGVGPEPPLIVRSANSDYPDATVMVYSNPDQDLTVVWVFDVD